MMTEKDFSKLKALTRFIKKNNTWIPWNAHKKNFPITELEYRMGEWDSNGVTLTINDDVYSFYKNVEEFKYVESEDEQLVDKLIELDISGEYLNIPLLEHILNVLNRSDALIISTGYDTCVTEDFSTTSIVEPICSICEQLNEELELEAQLGHLLFEATCTILTKEDTESCDEISVRMLSTPFLNVNTDAGSIEFPNNYSFSCPSVVSTSDMFQKEERLTYYPLSLIQWG